LIFFSDDKSQQDINNFGVSLGASVSRISKSGE